MLFGVDGYLTAVVAGPNRMMPSDWMVDFWPEEPDFNGAEEVQLVIGTFQSL
ncbi:MAG: UPF0149 family protein [Candidatus Binataceae bacterium]